jgi:hypothetical protein
MSGAKRVSQFGSHAAAGHRKMPSAYVQQEVEPMTFAPHPTNIRHVVFRTLQEVGAELDSLQDLRETILLNAGSCMARTYTADGYKAVWLLEEGTVQFTDREGKLVRVVNLYEEMPSVRLAA